MRVWLSKPRNAGEWRDIPLFVKPDGLRDELKRLGKKAIGDSGCVGHPF